MTDKKLLRLIQEFLLTQNGSFGLEDFSAYLQQQGESGDFKEYEQKVLYLFITQGYFPPDRKTFRYLSELLARIEGLADNPRPPGSEKLTNQERYRIRQGLYRILYEIHQKKLVVVVVKIGHRKNIYR